MREGRPVEEGTERETMGARGTSHSSSLTAALVCE